MPEKRVDVKRIQQLAFDAYKSSGSLSVLLEDERCPPGLLAESLETVATQMERGVVELRTLCESSLPVVGCVGRRAALKALEVAGEIESNEYGWIHIKLNTLLPHCRFTTPLWMTDTITRLLDQHERRCRALPMMERALLVIDEWCDVESRQVYDQDNKGWKAISNAIKGRLIPDDDQFSLGICLLSKRAAGAACHIYILPATDAGDFFSLKAENYPMFR